jgi:hypothetical protein
MLKPSKIRTCFLYDSETGRIAHIHKEITIGGGLHRTEAEIEARVRRFASKPHRELGNVKAVFVEDTRLRGKKYKIDPANPRLVEV